MKRLLIIVLGWFVSSNGIHQRPPYIALEQGETTKVVEYREDFAAFLGLMTLLRKQHGPERWIFFERDGQEVLLGTVAEVEQDTRALIEFMQRQ